MAFSKTRLRGVGPVGSLFVFISKGRSQAKVYATSSMQKKEGDALCFTIFQLKESVVQISKFQSFSS